VETGINRVYAIAYLFGKDIGLDSDAFRGDGGMDVTCPPDYAVLSPSERRDIAIGGPPLNLRPGTYGLALATVIVPVPGTVSRLGGINLGDSIASFEAGRAPHVTQLVLSKAAVRVAPAAFFVVESN
jgi:hypothetical protein